MKKLFSIVILCGILFPACKKENEDYRDQVLGTYTGILHFYVNSNTNYSTHSAIVTVNKSDSLPSVLVFSGDLTNYNSYSFIIESDYTFNDPYNSGYFLNDSLVFTLKRNYTIGKYYLQKN
jgi:hypothetical protein